MNTYIAWRDLENPDANFTIPEFIESISKLKGDIRKMIEAELIEARIGENYELTQTPEVLPLSKYGKYCRYSYKNTKKKKIYIYNMIFTAMDVDYDPYVLQEEVFLQQLQSKQERAAKKKAMVDAGQRDIPHFYRVRGGYHVNNGYKS